MIKVYEVGKKVFSLIVKRESNVLKAKITIFESEFELRLFTFLFVGELGIYLHNFYPHRTLTPIEMLGFSHVGMLKFN